MSSSIANDLTKWSNEQLCKNDDDDDDLYKKKSAECRHCMKVRKEAERQMAEEVARQKVEEEAKWKAEVEAQRAEAEAKACTEEVMQAQRSVSGPSKGKQPKAAASGAAEARKKKAQTQSPVADKDVNDKYEEEAEDEEAEEEHDALGMLTEVLVVVVTEMQDMAMDRRHVAVESHAQMEQMLGILEEI
ncbi:hypothetical protein PAXRUDRAFT_15508 [Paxillus rubicundulus Ve08.2h10]|uniref:Uncharacterized protein n=1 Tax=Paxillus rubicundulus Ve08.2h10 TaxID=930991 RepID=A0A0D0DAL2_9AGAM|nr:hypothetical protein PAXRUDRAFT_15508 [Paxillus rubicundulus Ve08.2h10]